jgi:hypothetical protein
MDKKRLTKHAIYNERTGCLISLYSRDRHGYPQFNVRGKLRRIHRFLLELKLKRELDIDEFAIHKCNNRECISTATNHVVKGNRSENTLDAIKRGSHNSVAMKGIKKPFRKPWKH